MQKNSAPRRLSRLLGLAALLTTGCVASSVSAAQADPTPHAKDKGRRKEQAKHQKNVQACRDDRDSRYDSRYRQDDRRYDTRYQDDSRRRQDLDRRRRDEERRRWEEEQRRREDDRYYDDRNDDRYGRSGG